MKKEGWFCISLVETAMGSLELVDKEERCPRGRVAARHRISHCQQLRQTGPSPAPHPCRRYQGCTRALRWGGTKGREACLKGSLTFSQIPGDLAHYSGFDKHQLCRGRPLPCRTSPFPRSQFAGSFDLAVQTHYSCLTLP